MVGNWILAYCPIAIPLSFNFMHCFNLWFCPNLSQRIKHMQVVTKHIEMTIFLVDISWYMYADS